MRAAALNSLSKASPTEGEMALLKWLPELKATEKAEMVSILAGSNQSAAVLMNVFGQKAWICRPSIFHRQNASSMPIAVINVARPLWKV